MTYDADNIGDLELAVLDYLWSSGAADVKTVHRSVGQPRGITYNTVQSALKRLYDKGLLTRKKESYAYIYVPEVDRRELTEHRLSAVVGELTSGELDVALEAFVDFAERTGGETLDRLEQLVADRKGEQGDG